jgi:hypothetical protein
MINPFVTVFLNPFCLTLSKNPSMYQNQREEIGVSKSMYQIEEKGMKTRNHGFSPFLI